MTILFWLLIAITLANALAFQFFWPRAMDMCEGRETIAGGIAAFVLFVVCYVGPVALGVVIGMLVRL